MFDYGLNFIMVISYLLEKYQNYKEINKKDSINLKLHNIMFNRIQLYPHLEVLSKQINIKKKYLKSI